MSFKNAARKTSGGGGRKHMWIRVKEAMTPPLTFSLLCEKIGYLKQSELQDGHISTSRKKDIAAC